MKKVDVLIVGQGIAGSLLAIELLRSNKRVFIIDDPVNNSSSRVAAGIYNPITGRNLVKTWLADNIFTEIAQYYDNLEKELAEKFHFQKKIYRPFVNVEEQNVWSVRLGSDEYEHYVEEFQTASIGLKNVIDPMGGLMLVRSGYIDLNKLLDAAQLLFRNKGMISLELFEFEKLDITGNRSYDDKIQFDKIIFCQGTKTMENKFWNHLKIKPLKGEILDIKCEMDANFILNRGVFMIQKEGFSTVGSNYNNNDLTISPTENGKLEILEKLNKIYTGEISILNHKAGIRPATNDRKPYIGMHQDLPFLGIFNGFGAKGVSLVPYFAKMMVEFLYFGKSVISEVSVDR